MESHSSPHALLSGPDASPSSTSSPPCAARQTSSPITPAGASPDLFGQQVRSLQLRNATFSQSILPTQRISPLFGFVPGGSQTRPHQKAQDDRKRSPRTNERSLYGESLPPTPVSILQEINNSARKRRKSPRSGFGMVIMEDPTVDENAICAADISWYNDRSADCSPTVLRRSATGGGLRDGSVNVKSVPFLGSPSVRQTKSMSVMQARRRSQSIEQSQYIEHLESQLASALAKVDSLSPSKTTKIRSGRLRSLTLENQNLKMEVADWASRAQAVAQEERQRTYDAEFTLKSTIRSLEEVMELKDAKIRELEWELESMQVQVKHGEGLQEINTNLERRIDMLTSLLVRPPNSPKPRSAAASPSHTEASRKTLRPRSVLHKTPSSPDGSRFSLASVSETAFWDSSSIIHATDQRGQYDHDGEGSPSPQPDVSLGSPDSNKRCSHSAMSFRSMPSSTSRPVSFMSMSSSTDAPSLTGSVYPELDARYGTKQRRMRRFPSGSNTLKPLILPAATSAPIASVPAPVFPSIDAVTQRNVSDPSSFDPTTSFLTKLTDGSPLTSPTVSSNHRSSVWVREQTLKVLEGTHTDDGIAKPFPVAISHSVAPLSFSPESEGPFAESDRQVRMTLQASQPQHQPQEPVVASAPIDALGISLDDSSHRDSGTADHANETLILPSTPAIGISSDSPCQQQNNESDNDKQTPCAPRPRSRDRSTRHSMSRRSRVLDTSESYGVLSRLTSLVTRTQQSPVQLAHRIIANAWILGSSSVSGLAWWLIGPLHLHQQRNRSCACPHQDSSSSQYSTLSWQHFGHSESPACKEGALCPAASADESHRHSHAQPVSSNTAAPRTEPHLFPCDACEEPSSRRTLRLWFQFSLSVVLAVGMALAHGPGVVLAESAIAACISDGCPRARDTVQFRLDKDGRRGKEEQKKVQVSATPPVPAVKSDNDRPSPPATNIATTTTTSSTAVPTTTRPIARCRRGRRNTAAAAAALSFTKIDDGADGSLRMNAGGDDGDGVGAGTADGGIDSGYGSIAFAEMLGPADFAC